MKRRLNVISLFAGAGGLEIAACETGKVRSIVSTDSNETFLQTVALNLPHHFPGVKHRAIVADARQLASDQLLQLLRGQPDIIMGGPPCDDFTSYGRKQGISGTKGLLIFEYVRIVSEVSPECFVFENVPNLAGQFPSAFKNFLSELEEHSKYVIKWQILHAADYGAPTQRRRIFVVGFRKKAMAERFSFPRATHATRDTNQGLFGHALGLAPHTHVADVLGDLPDVQDCNAKFFLNHTGRPHRQDTIEGFKKIRQGADGSKSYRYRAPWNGLCRSLTAGVDHATKSYIHPIHHREMSVREYARIHGFPDTWQFMGNHHNGVKQAANAVPIQLGTAVLRSVFDVIRSAKEDSR